MRANPKESQHPLVANYRLCSNLLLSFIAMSVQCVAVDPTFANGPDDLHPVLQEVMSLEAEHIGPPVEDETADQSSRDEYTDYPSPLESSSEADAGAPTHSQGGEDDSGNQFMIAAEKADLVLDVMEIVDRGDDPEKPGCLRVFLSSNKTCGGESSDWGDYCVDTDKLTVIRNDSSPFLKERLELRDMCVNGTVAPKLYDCRVLLKNDNARCIYTESTWCILGDALADENKRSAYCGIPRPGDAG